MSESWLHRKCTGAHCGWRDHCKNHGIPTTSDTRQWLWPVKTAEYCDFYVKKEQSWGEGKDGTT